jgi:Terminase large subunit, T4likevirus-type, N-terminal
MLILNTDKLKLNKQQAFWIAALQKVRLFLGGRGSGKTFAMGLSILLKMIMMPRSKGALASTNYYQLSTKTISSILKSWELMGMVKDVHYVSGKPPPKHWPRCINQPLNYKNVISVYWGSCIEMLSLERRDSARGGTYDYLEVDEAGLLEREDYTQALLPAVRDNKDVFNSPFHGQISFYTSIPRKPSGYWILDFEEKAKLKPKEYFFIETNAYDNIHVLGAEQIKLMDEELDYLEFMIEIMNHRIKGAKSPFYGKFDDKIHTHRPRTKGIEYQGKTKEVCDDVDPNKYIELSFDFGGHINCAVAFQQQANIERGIKEFYKKGKNTLKDLVKEICEHYEHHPAKNAQIWGDPVGWNSQPGSECWFDLLKEYFEENGWKIEVATPRGYRTAKHKTRQEEINHIFEGVRKEYPHVTFNEYECKNTITVIQTTESMNGEKIKSSEKNKNFPQELATHFSDCIDYYLYYKYVWKRKQKKGKRERGVGTSG